MLKKIALLMPPSESKTDFDFFSFYSAAAKHKIEIKFFEKSEDIDEFTPDCVIAFSPTDAKLTQFPTYGLINRDIQYYFELPRFTRNLLTYDGYLTISQHNKELLGDLLFGARKLDSKIAFFDLTPLSYKEPYTPEQTASHLLVCNNTPKNLNCNKLLKKIDTPQLNIVSPYENVDLESNALTYSMKNAHHCFAALFLALNDTDIIPEKLFSLIARGFPIICIRTKLLESYFGTNLYYIDPNLDLDEAGEQINSHLTSIKKNKKAALEKARQAKEIFDHNFAMDVLFNNLIELHQNTLLRKGYQPESLQHLKAIPSVSYIIRTGGKHRDFLERALDSLVKQTYKNIQVIFVIHASFSYLPEILEKYKSLNPTVLEYLKSIRSDAIAAGIAAVSTDYFGLLDDDDELHPNHVFSLIKTLQYHDQRDLRGSVKMAYSGSIIVHDSETVTERSEYIDGQYESRGEKRVTEHFRFFRQHEMSNHSWYMMSNSWLAHRDLIDDEILTKPGIDTCEDLYFELQFAQRTHFAFSVEMTAVHHYHSRGNSTIVDSHRHIADTQRIALRNFSRHYSGEFIYETYHLLVGRPHSEFTHYPKFLIVKHAHVEQAHLHNPLSQNSAQPVNKALLLKRMFWLGLTKFPKLVNTYFKLDKNKKRYYKQIAYTIYRKEGFLGLTNKIMQKKLSFIVYEKKTSSKRWQRIRQLLPKFKILSRLLRKN